MRKILLLFLVFASLHSVAQIRYNPGFHYVFFQQNELSGIGYLNDLEYHIDNHILLAGFDFAMGQGNKGIDVHKYDKLTFEYFDYYPIYPREYLEGPSIQFEDPIELDPVTARNILFSFRLGYGYSIPFEKSKLLIKAGPYIYYASNYYMIGVFENQKMDFCHSTGDIKASSDEFDLVMPVYLRYINLGGYASVEYRFRENKKLPLGVELSYYFGKHTSGLLALGIRIPLKSKKAVN